MADRNGSGVKSSAVIILLGPAAFQVCAVQQGWAVGYPLELAWGQERGRQSMFVTYSGLKPTKRWAFCILGRSREVLEYERMTLCFCAFGRDGGNCVFCHLFCGHR